VTTITKTPAKYRTPNGARVMAYEAHDGTILAMAVGPLHKGYKRRVVAVSAEEFARWTPIT